jgi:hypothetical protein
VSGSRAAQISRLGKPERGVDETFRRDLEKRGGAAQERMRVRDFAVREMRLQECIASFGFRLGPRFYARSEARTCREGPLPYCGGAQFEVTTLKSQHPVVQPDAEKAVVYFIEDDDSAYPWGRKPTIRAGLDGSWVGATHSNSFFYFSVAPGEHHLCAN